MRTIDTDLVVLAVGNEQDNAFYRLIKDAYITPELYLLGDAAHRHDHARCQSRV